MQDVFLAMVFSQKHQRILLILSMGLLFSCLVLGLALGMNTGVIVNLMRDEQFGEETEALPSTILDVNGEIITEFFSDEKREYIDINDLPKNLIYAITTREDSNYFYHRGFSVLGTAKAAAEIVLKGSVRGASTLTQQLAGNIYVDRTDIKLSRKLKELWWSYQMERQFTKNEILEKYLNKVAFGHNTYGVEAASEYFFDHSAQQNTIAESAMLVIQVANPSGPYSPFKNPEYARDRQEYVLDRMVEEKLINQEDAELSLEQYWNHFDWSRDNYSTAFMDRADKAPWFSEYIRGRLNELLFGQQDFYRDGYIVHTTLDLKVQAAADKHIAAGLERWTEVYNRDTHTRISYADASYTSLIDMLSLVFNITDIRVAGSQDRMRARELYFKDINPTVDMISQVFGLKELNFAANAAYGVNKNRSKQTTIQTALLTLGNDDFNEGYITAMVGGSEFSRTNQLNRAMDAQISPGSSFKPIYYSAGISKRIVTTATRLLDSPLAFKNADDTYYTPYNYLGEWEGSVLLRQALAHSMNVPSIQVLEKIGFDAAIERGAELLGVTDPVEIEKTFPRVYPLGLGIIQIAPVNMARAYATFSNYGTMVEPIGIRYIEDRDGNIILNLEKELRNSQSKKDREILTPQEAYVMITLLKSTVQEGTLSYYRRAHILPDEIEFAGKTGTTQNWADAWTCGFSPYYTTVIWAGFDEKGSSLGVHLTGATATGRTWAQYMYDIHQGLAPRGFEEPNGGLVHVPICTLSGKIPTTSCPSTKEEIFLSGTEPKTQCDIHPFQENLQIQKTDQMKSNFGLEGISTDILGNSGDSLDSLLKDLGYDLDDKTDSQSNGQNEDTDSGTIIDSSALD